MPTYSVDTALTMDETVKLKAITDKIESAVLDLAKAAGIYQSNNAGAAIESYSEAQQMWNSGIGMMRDALNDKIGALNNITENYVNTDNNGRNLFLH
ncbi:WXG100 family type VII secretion target [Actinoplanes sp. NPDC000266]